MRDESPEAVARRAADAQRKREERARKKLEAETQATQEKLAQAETVEQFWAASITKADPQQVAAWRVRQEEIFDTLYWMRQEVDGTYSVSPDDTECFVGIEEGDEDINRQLRDYGEAGITPFFILGEFLARPEV